ncbi:MAG: DUF4350 domain-containing protein [Gammaproteobacteria bacterium]|nr:DUF4350 domain-containing protein [Gammaproteobacteria bacterium]MBU1490029.1 DUF4350 domain-containing protein [Gammaproteobacteria bacterium]MBU2064287.1 DUF4350 domain-containing protein [Gammaproteobacteria bacterium]MBU2137923.1 DUF4350 domain-containing protein [Gammaproteobacteria bacterium]MBU2218146.1 DUF4350 domain-containing protein [Gammaproteobacteria bacterium]
MSRRHLPLVVLALLLTALGAYLLSHLQPYDEVVELGPSPEAKSNPYLAAEYFLRERGLNVQRAEGLASVRELPSVGQTLLLLGDRQRMTPRQAERLLEWAAKGGHLLFVAERLWDEERGESGDLLLDRLGIQQHSSPPDDAEPDAETETDSAEQAAAETSPAAEDASPYPQLTQLYLENETAPAYIDFATDFHLYDAENRAHAWANSAEATHLLQLYHGDGLISVLTDSWIWQTEQIAEYDNAWLLWYLSQDSDVTLLYRAERDNLATLLLRHFLQALCALALLIALGLWHVGQRSGPLLPAPSLARRSLREHLRGSADFLLRRAGQPSLLQGLQHDILRRARRRHPGFERLAVAEQWQVLSRLSRLPTSAIGQAMRPVPASRVPHADFIRQVTRLQTLRNAL